MTGFTADLFHKGMLWGLAERYCAVRGAFSSAIYCGFVLPFQGQQAWGFEQEGCDRIAVGGTLQRAVPDPRRLCLYCSFLTMFFRLSSLTVYTDSLQGVLEACWKSGEIQAAVSSLSFGDTSTSVAIWDPEDITHNVVRRSRWYCTPLPHRQCRTLQNFGKMGERQDAGSRVHFSHGQILYQSTKMKIARFSFAPVMTRKEPSGQAGLATLSILAFSSPKLHAPSWLCSNFSFPFMVRSCTSEAVACSHLLLWLVVLCCFWVGTKTASYVWSSQMQAEKDLVSRRYKSFLVLTHAFLWQLLVTVWQQGGQGEPNRNQRGSTTTLCSRTRFQIRENCSNFSVQRTAKTIANLS